MSGAVVASSAGLASANAGAGAAAIGSPGVLSGNVLQVPIDIPINACGNTINLPGFLNPTFGNTCINADTHRHVETREFRQHRHHAEDED
ncbi:chaplin [Streptomyces sp. NPDC054933]